MKLDNAHRFNALRPAFRRDMHVRGKAFNWYFETLYHSDACDAIYTRQLKLRVYLQMCFETPRGRAHAFA